MRTEQEIREEIATFEEAYQDAKRRGDDHDRVTFSVRICALEWVLFEPYKVCESCLREGAV